MGSEGFVERVHAKLGIRGGGRRVAHRNSASRLGEARAAYMVDF